MTLGYSLYHLQTVNLNKYKTFGLIQRMEQAGLPIKQDKLQKIN